MLAIERVPDEFPPLPGSSIRLARVIATNSTPALNVLYRFHGADAQVPVTLLFVELG